MRISRFVAKLTMVALVVSIALPALPVAAIVDTTAPTVTGLAPTTTYKNMATTFTANYNDSGTGVASCTLYINGISQGVGIMTRTGGFTSGVASQIYTYSGSAPSFTAQVSCTDMAASPNTGYSTPPTTVTVFVDNWAPVVTNQQPGTAIAGVPTTISVNYEESGAGINTCGIIVDDVEMGLMTFSGSTASIGYTFPSAGNYTVDVNCYDKASNPGSSSRVVAVSSAGGGASIGIPSPTSATAGTVTNFSATITDSSGAYNTCGMYIGTFSFATLSRSGSSLTGSYTFATPDTYSVHAECAKSSDPSQKVSSPTVTLTVSAAGGGSATATMGTLAPTTATAGSATTFSTTINDSSAKWNTCALYVGGANVASMTRSGSSVSGSYTFATAGSYVNTYARCHRSDDPTQSTQTVAITVTVSAAGGGSATASMGTLNPSTALAGISTSFSTTITDTSVKWSVCSLYVSNISVATMTRSGSNVTGSYTFPASGNYQTYVQCQRSDTPPEPVKTTTIAVAVSAPGAADTAQPTIANVNPSTATTALPVSIIADVTDNVGATSCTLTVDNVLQGDMTLAVSALGPTIRHASRVHLFSSTGTRTVEVRCLDAAGNAGTYTRTVSVVTAGTPPPPPTTSSNDTDSDRLTNSEEASLGTSPTVADTDGDQLSDYEEVRIYHSDPLKRDTDGDGFLDGHEVLNGYSPTGPGRLTGTTPNTGTLIKMPCPIGASVNHPCKAVYFYGRDGKRHPFPHEKTYFSWYPNFGSVQNVSQEALSALPLGTNVTYRPGVRLVKFQTLNTVYAVTRGGLLRALASESVAVAVYGTTWNRQVDDIGDAFFSNYTFGTDITQANQYVPLTETAAVLSIDDNL